MRGRETDPWLTPARYLGRCPMCGGAGWTLDCDPRPDEVALELIPCIYPTCWDSGKAIAILSFKTSIAARGFTKVARHPGDNLTIMSVSP